MRSTILIILIGFVISTFYSMGQDQGTQYDEVWLEQLKSEYSYQLPGQDNLNNQAYIVQEGSGNNVYVNQQNPSTLITPNNVFMLQKGNNNSGFIFQAGVDNQYNVYQLGNNNQTDLSMRGKKNVSTLLQEGNSNLIKQELQGNGMNYVILQEGFKNELYHKENGEVNQKYTIQMKGNGMKIYIENGNIYK